ncbi:DUF1848 domain-containing protein [Arenibaculum pallidiluteum]|uniref:DUF1848 domain-containing protein n=1 Tax=Arenibaculum pallidiluteum TaxID=2812559 RepID=UPI001A96AF6B|nr:DUF1848 family protein [Arenibaculum pallidiluteum]
MIVSASYRTDIPAHYGRWFLNRLEAGHCMVPNPYGGPPARVGLSPGEVDGFVFWTRNPGPFDAAFEVVRARGTPFFVQMTITGYPRAVEPHVPGPEAAVAMLRHLAARHGPRAVVWRYDPILVTAEMDAAWHREGFARLARALRGATDEVVASFVAPYRKTARNLAQAGLAWRDPEEPEKRELMAELAAIAGEHGMRLSLCAQPALADTPGTAPARCVDAARLSDVAGRPLRARERGNRPGCLCAESRDIGAYDTCLQGCAYCYAVSGRSAALRRRAAHDPAAEALAPRG